MKTRQGFVSNSSSSSFIILGCKVSEEMLGDIFADEVKEYLREWKPNGYNEEDLSDAIQETAWDKDVFSDDNGFILGEVLGMVSDGYLDSKEYGIEELQKMTKEIADKYGVDEKEVKLSFGTRAC